MEKHRQGIIHLGVLAILAIGILAVVVLTISRGDLLSRKQTQSKQAAVGNLFTIGSDSLKTCLKAALGEKAYSEIAQEKRGPDEDEAREVLSCFRKFGRKDSSPSQFVSEADLADPDRLTRRYPDFIKCAMVAEPKVLRFTFLLKSIKELNLNTVCIYLTTPKFVPSLRHSNKENERRILELKWAIGKIKSEGLAVRLIQDLCCYDAEQEMLKGTLDEMLAEIEKENLMWAKVAEEYKVEYFTPLGEVEGRIDWFKEKENLTRKDQLDKTNKWMASVLSKLRKVYRGKLVAHYSELYPELNPTGYDYFGFTLDTNTVDLGKFRQRVKDSYQLALDLEEKYGAEWIIPEAYFAWQEPSASPTIQAWFKKYEDQLRALQDDYLRISFEEILALPPEKRPAGFSVHAPLSTPPLTDESLKEVRDFFSKMPGDSLNGLNSQSKVR